MQPFFALQTVVKSGFNFYTGIYLTWLKIEGDCTKKRYHCGMPRAGSSWNVELPKHVKQQLVFSELLGIK